VELVLSSFFFVRYSRRQFGPKSRKHGSKPENMAQSYVHHCLHYLLVHEQCVETTIPRVNAFVWTTWTILNQIEENESIENYDLKTQKTVF
jgi:hypothetical protein